MDLIREYSVFIMIACNIAYFYRCKRRAVSLHIKNMECDAKKDKPIYVTKEDCELAAAISNGICFFIFVLVSAFFWIVWAVAS